MRHDHHHHEIDSYVDGEMDAGAQLRFEARMQEDAWLRAQVEAVEHLSCRLRAETSYHRLPAGFDPLPRRAAVRAPAAARLWDQLLRALAWRPLVPAAIALAAVLVVNVAVVDVAGDRQLVDELVASHVRATMSGRAVDVASTENPSVKPWLSSNLDFSPPVRTPNVPGCVLVGGRVDYLEGRRVAVLVYQQGNHLVDHYMWPTSAGDGGQKVQLVNGFRVGQWNREGLAHRIVSDVSASQLHDLMTDLQTNDGA